jgi:flavin reductase (DIM6/NTAB) family NADH-FMN oxidoreductase RutF
MITKSSPFEARELRHAFGSFGTGVTVVTSRHADGRKVGVTANSFSSVSLDPPIVLWSLATASPSLDVFDNAGRFVINVLSLAQLGVSRQFSSKVADRFAGVIHHDGLDGLPVLDGCTATIECRTLQRTVVGDHILFLGQVERYSYHRIAPLLFCQGHYLQGVGLDSHANACNANA